jgi:hypothetical protein
MNNSKRLDNLTAALQGIENALFCVAMEIIRELAFEAGKDGLSYEYAEKWLNQVFNGATFEDWWERIGQEMTYINEDCSIIVHPAWRE